MRTEHRDQASFCPFALREVSVLAELALGHLRYSLTDVPPQSNSRPSSVLESDYAGAYNGDRTKQQTEMLKARNAPEGNENAPNNKRAATSHTTLHVWFKNTERPTKMPTLAFRLIK